MIVFFPNSIGIFRALFHGDNLRLKAIDSCWDSIQPRGDSTYYNKPPPPQQIISANTNDE